jgi:hypothetical protein
VTALFEIDGDRVKPAPEGRAMWYEDALHGGPIAALFAREAERAPAPVPMRVVRLGVDLLRPVPTSPLRLESRVTREGRRIQVIESVLSDGDVPLARSSAIRIRSAEISVPDHCRRDPPPPPEQFPPYPAEPAGEAWYHVAAMEFRFAEGDFLAPGPATVWFRLTMPVVEGEEPSPVQRVASASDFGNGISMVLHPAEHLFINPDVTLYVHRDPVDEWVCLRARTDVEATGVGLAQSEIFDREGAVGHALQSLFVEPRGDLAAPGRFMEGHA